MCVCVCVCVCMCMCVSFLTGNNVTDKIMALRLAFMNRSVYACLCICVCTHTHVVRKYLIREWKKGRKKKEPEKHFREEKKKL